MCDFSLHAVRSRPAKVGDKLTTQNFNWATIAFCAPEDAGMAVCLVPGTEGPLRIKLGGRLSGRAPEWNSATRPRSSARSTKPTRTHTMTRWSSRTARSSF